MIKNFFKLNLKIIRLFKKLKKGGEEMDLNLNDCLLLKSREKKLYQKLKKLKPEEISSLDLKSFSLKPPQVGEATLKNLKVKIKWLLENWEDIKKRFLTSSLEEIIEIMEKWVALHSSPSVSLKLKIILKERFKEGKTFREIGKELGCSRQAVHQLYQRYIEKSFLTPCWSETFKEYLSCHNFQKRKKWKKLVKFLEKVASKV